MLDVVGGHPAPAGRALPNLINAVSMLKSKSKQRGFDFNILTALKGWVGQAAKRTGALHIIILTLNDYIIARD
jgi:hypothetical protein